MLNYLFNNLLLENFFGGVPLKIHSSKGNFHALKDVIKNLSNLLEEKEINEKQFRILVGYLLSNFVENEFEERFEDLIKENLCSSSGR